MIDPCRCFKISLIEEEPLVINLLEEPDITFGIDIGTVIIGGEYPTYYGPYEAVPKVEDQIFETKKKSMEENFTVTKIPYQEVSNPQGGETVIIAFD